MSEDTAERWAPIPERPGYEVSTIGRVQSLDREIVDSTGRKMRRRGIMMRIGFDQNGYPRVRLGGNTPPLHVHRLILSAFVGPCPPGMMGLHNNGVPADCRLENLRWGTASENTADMIRHGTCHALNKTHCIRNHPLSGDNLNPGHAKLGSRACRACSKAAARIYRFRRQGKPEPDMQEESDRMYAEILAGFANGNDLKRARARMRIAA